MAEDIENKVKSFGRRVWRKTQGAFDVVSNNAEIAAKSRELRTIYAEIGRQYCVDHQSEADASYPELRARALELATEIDRLEKETLAARGYRKCASCGEEIDANALFCPRCGAAQPQPEPTQTQAEEQPERHCPACGEKQDEDNLFCSKCGAKLS